MGNESVYFLLACKLAFMWTDDKVVRSGNCTYIFDILSYVSVYFWVNGILLLAVEEDFI